MATRDYKKRSSPPKRNTTPGWVWLLAGLAVGLFVAFLVYLNRLPASRHSPHLTKDLSALAKSAVQDARSVKKEVTATAPDMQAKEKHKGINFDFYNILPEMEVPVPDNEPQGKGLPPAPVAPGTYVLQVGSFRSEKEADAQKANLALLGIVSSIQSVTINGTDTWHRVRIGPISDMNKLDQVRGTLKQNNVRFVLFREKS